MLISVSLSAQNKDPYKILDEVKSRFDRVKDYSVDVSVKLDINFIKVPDMKAKVYFKQPDKVKLESKGFAMLPKQGVSFSPAALLKGNYTAVFVKSEKIDGFDADVIKVIPDNDTTDIVLSTVWIDASKFLVRKVEITGKKMGTQQINLSYSGDMKFNLPSQIKFTFNLGDIQMPPDISAPQQQDEHSRRNRGPLKGTVIVTYQNYSVNQGIADSFFEEDKTKK